MSKRRPAPSTEEIYTTLERAHHGKGRQLALLVKSFSVEDLAFGFSRGGLGLAFALNCAAGRKQARAEHTASLRRLRKGTLEGMSISLRKAGEEEQEASE